MNGLMMVREYVDPDTPVDIIIEDWERFFAIVASPVRGELRGIVLNLAMLDDPSTQMWALQSRWVGPKESTQ